MGERIRGHRDLIAWRKAMALAERVYEVCGHFPERERFGLWSQMTRAASAIPANIAEGHGRSGAAEFAQFVSIARGSLSELDTFVELASRLGYLADPERAAISQDIDELIRILTGLARSLRGERRSGAASVSRPASLV